MGKRVTLQYFDDEGARHEVVGVLERAEAAQKGEPLLHIRRRDDSLVVVPLGRIRAGRVVTPR